MTDSDYFYEKEAEYFGFTPFQLLDQIGEIVVKIVFDMFDNVTENIGKHITFLNKGQIEAGVGQWCSAVEAKFTANYELFESYVIKNVLLIPDKFNPPHQRILSSPLSMEEESKLDEQISSLLERLARAKITDAYLEHEELVLRQEEEAIARIEAQLDSLKNKLQQHGSFETMTFALSEQLEALRGIVIETIEQSKNLQVIDLKNDDGWDLEGKLILQQQKQQPGHAIVQLTQEWTQCQQVATMEDLNALLF